MEEKYQIIKTGQPDTYVVVRKEHPGFITNLKLVDNKLQITKITLMDNCELSVLTDALNEIEYYFKEEKLRKLLEAPSK